MNRFFLLLALLIPATVPAAAMAYVGPGAGLLFLGPALTVFGCITVALLMVLIWPIRVMRRKLKNKKKNAASTANRE